MRTVRQELYRWNESKKALAGCQGFFIFWMFCLVLRPFLIFIHRLEILSRHHMLPARLLFPSFPAGFRVK